MYIEQFGRNQRKLLTRENNWWSFFDVVHIVCTVVTVCAAYTKHYRSAPAPAAVHLYILFRHDLNRLARQISESLFIIQWTLGSYSLTLCLPRILSLYTFSLFSPQLSLRAEPVNWLLHAISWKWLYTLYTTGRARNFYSAMYMTGMKVGLHTWHKTRCSANHFYSQRNSFLLKGPYAIYILIPHVSPGQGATGSSLFFGDKWKPIFFSL